MSNQRVNNATHANVDRRIYAQGTFKNVRQGTYTRGARTGEKCVAKEFRTGSVYEARYFDQELAIIAHAQRIIDAWHLARVTSRRTVLSRPQIWTYETSGRKCLVEPMIENFEKFNSNSGWADRCGGSWSDAMQALSHFSYHNSDGKFLLCDLQGGIYSDGYILSDPVIMSELQDCGPADLGLHGIRSFFARHQCTQFCNPDWKRPLLPSQLPLYPARQGTTMRDLPIRESRNPLTRLQQ